MIWPNPHSHKFHTKSYLLIGCPGSLPKNCVIFYIEFIEFTPQFHIIFDN